MSWIKLDDQWMDHPKIIKAGRDARDIWLASITWCAKHLTDGYFPTELLPSLAVSAGVPVANCQTFATTLLEVCLWDATSNGYMVHDYLDYNPTKEQTEANRMARAAAGKAGGDAKASKMASKTLANGWQKSGKSLPRPRTPIPQKRQDKPVADDRSKHPAILCVKEVTKHYPSKAIYDDIIGIIGESPDKEKFLKVHTTWVKRGYNPTNFDGQLNWYRDGIPERGNGNGIPDGIKHVDELEII